MLYELDDPSVHPEVVESTNVQAEYSVRSFLLVSHGQRIQRLVPAVLQPREDWPCLPKGIVVQSVAGFCN